MGAAEYNFNIYNSLILAGIVQGFVFAFNTAFKKITSLTPSEYRNKNIEHESVQKPVS
jgi:hypothetical protein